MKAYLHPQLGQELKRTVRRMGGGPVAERAFQALGAAVVGFFLSGFRVAGALLPLPICLSAAMGLSFGSFGAYVGGCVGYLVFYPQQSMEMIAAGLLVQASLCIFGEDLPQYDRWFSVGAASAFTALVGFLFLVEQRFAVQMIWRYMLRVVVAGGGALCFRMALQEKKSLCRLILYACLCAGACAVKLVHIPLGAIGACAIVCTALETPMALTAAGLCGLALDLSWAPGCAAGIFAMGALVCKKGSRIVRLGCWLLCVLLGVLTMQTVPLFLAAAFLGGAMSLFMPVSILDLQELPSSGGADPRLDAAAGLLRKLADGLANQREGRPSPEMAAVFDQAADKVCRVCGGWDRCWNEHGASTVEELEYAAPAMLTRGRAQRRDLPESFIERCCHVDGFLTAVNQELDDLSCRRQCRSRIEESRKILTAQYALLSEALLRTPYEKPVACRYRAEVGFRSKLSSDGEVSGDRGVSFRIGKFFYLILTDGMGTGEEAEQEAQTAIELLRTLLQTGAKPSQAMELLNGIYVLRDDGGFATVDLVQTDLTTGETELLKWGAAASYLKRKTHVEKLGTSAPPPGIGVGDDFTPEKITLSLSKGEMLILLSDGAATEMTERYLRQYAGAFPREIASGIINAQEEFHDDTTAAVLMLRPRLTQ